MVKSDIDQKPATAPELERRQLLKKLVWVAPAIVATASVKARAALVTCSPTTCAPVTNPCRPTR